MLVSCKGYLHIQGSSGGICMRALRLFLFVIFLASWAPGSDASTLGFTTPQSTSKNALSPVAETHFRDGVNALNKGRLDEAKAAFEQSISAHPRQYKSYIGLADLSFKLQKPRDAEGYLKKAIEMAPESAEARTAWGRYLYSQKRIPEAEAAFKKAVSLSQNEIFAHIDLGDFYMNAMNRPKEAAESYRKALQIDPKHPGARYALGLASFGLGDLKEARSNLEEASVLAPENPLPHQALGNLFALQKDYGSALGEYARALKAKPDFIPAYLSRGDIFLMQGDDKKAIEEYERSLKKEPKLAVSQLKIGMVHEKFNRYNQAKQAYDNAIKIDPKFAPAYNNLAWMAAERKENLKAALVWAKKAVELAPDVAEFQDTLGWVYRARGELANAVSALEKASRAIPPKAEIFYHLGIAYSEQGNAAASRPALEKALELNKSFKGADDARQRLLKMGKK